MMPIKTAVLVLGVIVASAAMLNAADNLINNPSFEEGATGQIPPRWWNHFAYDGKDDNLAFPFTIAEGGKAGGHCALVEVPEGFEFSLIQQYVDAPNDPAKGLRLSAWLHTDGPAEGEGVQLGLIINAPNRNAFRVARTFRTFSLTSEWQAFSMALPLRGQGIRPGDKLVARAIVQALSPIRRLYVDDVSLTVIDAQEAYDAFKSAVPAKYRKHLLDASKHASFVTLKDGRPAIFYWRNTPVFRTSDDQGLTWGLPEPIHLSPDVCSKRMIQPVRLKSGALGLVTVGKGNTLFFTKSTDEGKTWGETVAINPKGPLCWPLHDSAFVTSKGRIVVPGWITFRGDEHDNKNWSGPVDVETYCWLSDDEGKTWFKGGNVVTEHEGRKLPFEETVGVELKDGRLMLLGRTPMARIFKSTSSDGGETWTSPEPTPLVSSYAPCALARMSNGDLVCVFNQASVEEVRQNYRRQRLTAAVSSDDGETWKHHRNLESLDDRHKIDQPVNWDVFSMHHERFYQQPTDKELYPHAPGPLCVTYPSIGATPDRVIVAYSYAVLPGGVRGPLLKVRSLPIEWFYESP